MSGSAPPDNSVQLESMQESAAQRQAAQDKADAAAKEAAFQQQLNSVYNNGISDAQTYFQQRGLDPKDYIADIQSAANRAKSSTPDLAANPQTYFDNLGATVYQQDQDAARANYLREINQFAPSNLSTTRISDAADQPTLDAILAEQQQNADQYVRNLLDRGVITQAGYNAAEANIANQVPGAKSQLSDIGTGILEGGRDAINNIANDARTAASNYNLGDQFDPYSYSKQIDQSALDFFTNLGTKIRAAAPTALFSTSGLANIAGAASGAQNTAFDPSAIAGVSTKSEDDNSKKTTNASNPF